MDFRKELENYEIGGIGDIKKHTLRFHSYRIGTEDGKLTIYAEYESGKLPKVFDGYPSGQELLIDLCNLHMELRNKSMEECARILIRWSVENLHPYYHYGDEVETIEYRKDDPDEYWDAMVNMLGCYYVYVEDMLRDLEQLHTAAMTVFALKKLMDGDVAEAQKLYENVRVPEKDNLMGKWYFATPEQRPFVIKEAIEKLPRFAMSLEYDLSDGQIKLQPTVRSVIDAACYALGRFAAVNAGALDDYGGKTNIAFCQACGKAFIKRGNRQKYCGTTQCQSIRNNRKSSDYYYRKKKANRGGIHL